MSFTLANQRENGFHALASGSGLPGKYTKEAGILAYYEVLLNLQPLHSGFQLDHVLFYIKIQYNRKNLNGILWLFSMH
jgi:hypothetical protein